MAQSGYTPISLYFSATGAAVPTAGNLVAGELALNTNDDKLYFKNSSGVVTLLAGSTSGPAGGSNTQVQYNNSGVLAGITGATTNGTALTLVAPVLGTPASGTVTNLTGTASININGTVGATTPTTGAFTTVSATGTGAFLLGSGATTAARYAQIINNGSANGVLFGTEGTTAGGILTGSSSYSGIISQTGNLDLALGTFGVARLIITGAGAASFSNGLAVTGTLSATGTLSGGTSGTAYSFSGSAPATSLTLDSSGNLGVNTTSMGRKLNIAAPTAAGIQLQSTGTGARNFSVFATDSNASVQSSFAIFDDTASAYRMIIDSGGNLGLGVTPSAWGYAGNLQFVNGGAIGSINKFSHFVANAYFNSDWKYASTATSAARYTQNDGAHEWHNAASGTAGNAISFTQAMTLDASGNLGIGTTTALSRLTTSVSAGSAGAVNNQIAMTHTGASTGYYIATIRAAATDEPVGLAFKENSTERARIDSSGNLLVGKTTTSSGVGGNNFGLGASQNYNESVTTESTTTLAIWYFNRQVSTGSIFEFRQANSAVGSITVTSTITLYNTTSDYRLKTVIGAVSDSGSRIDALQPVEYTWNADGSRTRGFLAHQFQEVYASSVSGTKDAVDADGKPVYQAMQAATSEVIADLVAELQSLRARVAQLESKP